MDNKQTPNLSTKIVNKCVDKSGLKAWGATRPELPEKWKERFQKWLKKGYYADMSWIRKNFQSRVNVKLKFPWCKSVIVVADNYYSRPIKKPDIPYVSIYAHGQNYHQLVAEKLEKVARCLKIQYPDLKYKSYVDTGPVLERAYAVEAGLGWIGKNNMIIVDNLGSYCFLGILLLNAQMDSYGSPKTDKCGDCKRCIENCPTGALEGPYIHNSRKCISYLTIEKKGGFNQREKTLIDRSLYGCDRCLEVCPWNKKWATRTEDKRYYDRKEYLKKSIKAWERISRKEFRKVFRDSVFKRLKYRRLKRNLEAIKDS